MGINVISSSSTVDLMNSLVQAQSASASKSSNKASAQKAGGPPPAGTGAAAKAPESPSSSSTTSTAKIYEAADTNKDGKVSFQEELAYSLKHPADETEKQAEVSTSQMQTGLKSYKQSQETNSSSQSSPLFSI